MESFDLTQRPPFPDRQTTHRNFGIVKRVREAFFTPQVRMHVLALRKTARANACAHQLIKGKCDRHRLIN